MPDNCLDDVNVRRTVTIIKTNLSKYLEGFIFEKMDDKESQKAVKDHIENAFRKYLDMTKSNSDLVEYSVNAIPETWEILYPNRFYRYWIKFAKYLGVPSSVIGKRKIYHFLFPYKKTYEYTLTFSDIDRISKKINDFRKEYDDPKDSFSEFDLEEDTRTQLIHPEVSVKWKLRYPNNIYVDVKLQPAKVVEYIKLSFLVK